MESPSTIEKKRGFFATWLIVLGLLAPFLFILFYNQNYQWESIWKYRSLFIKGWFVTILISLASFFVSSAIGILTAAAKLSKWPFLRLIATFYTELIRGTPLLVQLLFFFYVIAHTFSLDNRYVVGILILSMFTGAYLAEIIRGGIESVKSSQIQAALSLGFTRTQTYRHIIFPQVFRQILPALAGQFASLVKDSSLLSILGIRELTFSAEQVTSATYNTLESFFPLAIGYLLLTLPFSFSSKWLEKRYAYET